MAGELAYGLHAFDNLTADNGCFIEARGEEKYVAGYAAVRKGVLDVGDEVATGRVSDGLGNWSLVCIPIKLLEDKDLHIWDILRCPLWQRQVVVPITPRTWASLAATPSISWTP